MLNWTKSATQRGQDMYLFHKVYLGNGNYLFKDMKFIREMMNGDESEI